jgi:hypothetical protein
MYEVKYGYFNYPMKEREFKTYEEAKKFFYFIRNKYGVKRVELNCPA